MAQGSIQGREVVDIVRSDALTTRPGEPLSRALHFMSDRDVGRIPVLDPGDPSRLVGLLRRENIVRAYRHAILKKLENQHRRDHLRLGSLTDMEILEIHLSNGMASIGKCIHELDLPPQALITTIRREDEILIAHGETELQAGDTVIVLTHQAVADAVQKTLIDKE